MIANVKSFFLIGISIFCVVTVIATSAQSNDITITNIQDAQEFLSDNFNPVTATISPDGSRIAWVNWMSETLLCHYEFETENEQCIDYNQAGFGSLIRDYTWSPDGRYIAFSETGNDRGFDSDLWIFDFVENELMNLTDDNLGQMFSAQPEMMMWDVRPIWSPTNQDVYFFRVEIEPDWENNTFNFNSLKIFKASITDNSIHEVIDISHQLITNGTLHHAPIKNLEGGAAISANGRYMAVVNTSPDLTLTSAIWIIDLEGENEPYILAEFNDVLSAGSPRDFEERHFTHSLAWVAEDTGILFSLTTTSDSYVANLVYLAVEPNSTIIPLVDFSDFDLEEMTEITSSSDFSPQFFAPRYAVPLSDSYTILTWHQSFLDSAYGVITLPPDTDTEIEFIHMIEQGGLRPDDGGRSTYSDIGQALMGGVLFQVNQ